MKELNQGEIEKISGGVGIAFLMGALGGASGTEMGTIIGECAIVGGVLAGIICPPLFFITAPIGATLCAIEGTFGYAVGSLVYNRPAKA